MARLKTSPFYVFFRGEDDVEEALANRVEDKDYIEWNGMFMPMHYSDAEAEYHAVRNEAAICDVTPMQKIRITGSGAGTFLDYLGTRPVSHMPAMHASYIVFCHENGSLMDDAVFFKFSDDDYLLLPSDIDHTRYFESICTAHGIKDVSFRQCADELAGLAIQGPRSAAAVLAMGFEGAEEMKPFELRDAEFEFGNVWIGRVGYTADLGYEIWMDTSLAPAFARQIEAARSELGLDLPGYGLTTLQVCRIEGGFIVAGWDCASTLEPDPYFERTPLELGLGWMVKTGDIPFRGREALARQISDGTNYLLRSFCIDENRQPADRTPVVSDDGTVIGQVTCAFWSWGLGCTIGHASIGREHAALESAWVDIDGARVPVSLVEPPLINLARRNLVPAPLE